MRSKDSRETIIHMFSGNLSMLIILGFYGWKEQNLIDDDYHRHGVRDVP